jgi:DNA-binding response OmpR family regulator
MKLLERNPPFILFADDDAATLDVFRAYTQALKWTGDFVGTAREIIAAVNQACDAGRCYDALVCDVNYFDERPDSGPRLTGVTAARVIRQTHPDLPVVFVSGFTSHLIRGVINEVGADFYEKPVDFEVLFSRIAYLIRWSRIVQPPQYHGQERRKETINKSGQYRRRSDSAIEIPPILDTLNKEVRADRERRNQAGGILPAGH